MAGAQLDSFLFKSISYNVSLQVSLRLLSFALNALLFRRVSTELIGACNFRLALLYTTVMFLSREPFRRALPTLQAVAAAASSSGQQQQQRWSSFVNSVWLVVPNGLLVAGVFGSVWALVLEQPDAARVPHYGAAVLALSVACVLELVGEPANCLLHMLLLAKQKVLVEAVSQLVFNVIFVVLALYVPALGALAYALARCANALICATANFYFLQRHRRRQTQLSSHNGASASAAASATATLELMLPDESVLPLLGRGVGSGGGSRRDFGAYFDAGYLGLVRAYYTQSVFKQVLTEGERYLITVFGLLSFAESGVYDIVNNLGSLIARFVFLPIEDAAYVYFTNAFQRGRTFAEQQQQTSTADTCRAAKSYFELLLKIVSMVGLLVLVYGQSYAALLLQLYGGDQLGRNDTCVNMLRFYCVYIFLLALNGVTEAFFNATLSEAQVQRHNYRLVLFSVVFLAFAFVAAKLFHIYGFILANCFNMLARVYYSCGYINRFFVGSRYGISSSDASNSGVYVVWKGIVPDAILGGTFLFGLFVTKASESVSESSMWLFCHLLIGASVFLVNLYVIYRQEKQLASVVVNFLRRLTKSKS